MRLVFVLCYHQSIIVSLSVDEQETKTKQKMEAGKTGNISCKADGAPKPTFKWSFPSNKSYFDRPDDIENGVLYFSNVTSRHAGVYNCTISQSKGISSSRESIKKVIYVTVYSKYTCF